MAYKDKHEFMVESLKHLKEISDNTRNLNYKIDKLIDLLTPTPEESTDEGIVVLISGRGSNLEAILQSPIGNKVLAVISNNVNAKGLSVARKYGKKTHFVFDDMGKQHLEDSIIAVIQQYKPSLIVLAGFMRILSKEFINANGGRIINIHPSLLPSYPGLFTHEKVLANGDKEHGCTVHWVTEGVDEGDIIAQVPLEVYDSDTEESLAKRVLELEHRIYPGVIEQVLLGNIEMPTCPRGN